MEDDSHTTLRGRENPTVAQCRGHLDAKNAEQNNIFGFPITSFIILQALLRFYFSLLTMYVQVIVYRLQEENP